MRALLSAYACEPEKGSEPGMGWHWAVEIARLGHEVHILTRANNVPAIECALASLGGLPLFVHGYDLPGWARWWKRGPRGMHLYYSLWQWGAYRRARALHRARPFDRVHHITFAVYRQPSFMGRLGIPFILGPIGGGEKAPLALLWHSPWRAKVAELLRWMGDCAAAIDPLVKGTMRSAALIFCKTPETLAVVPKRLRARCVLLQDVGVDSSMLAQAPSNRADPPRFLFAGNLLHLKGIHLILAALARVRSQLPAAALTIVGDGPDRAWLERIARRLGIAAAVDWRGRLPRSQLLSLYKDHTAFVFPSLHDSGGTVVMEALSQGTPVICLDLGGPGVILPADSGIKIPARGRSEKEIVANLASAMISVAADTALRARLAANALEAARHTTWSALAARAYMEIESALAADFPKP